MAHEAIGAGCDEACALNHRRHETPCRAEFASRQIVAEDHRNKTLICTIKIENTIAQSRLTIPRSTTDTLNIRGRINE